MKVNLVTCAIKVARYFYDEETYYHAMRVAGYVINDNLIPKEKIDTCVALAIMHDLMKYTKFDYEKNYKNTFGIYSSEFKKCLELLTNDKKRTYGEYLQKIKDSYTLHPEAYWVKLADIKDRLEQNNILTEKQKEKYYSTLPILL